jgi:hypothetical protein
LSGGTKKLEIGNCTGETNGFHLVYISPIHLPAGHHHMCCWRIFRYILDIFTYHNLISLL